MIKIEEEKLTKKRKYFYNLLLLVVTVIISLLVAESISRVYFSPIDAVRQTAGLYDASETRSLKYRPNSEVFYTCKCEDKYTWNITINSKGLRDYEYSYEKPNNTYRVVMLGDSMTSAHEVLVEDTFENVLERKLNNDAGNYEVLNLGVKAYSIQQEFVTLEEEGFKYDPDMVILNFYVGNDFLGSATQPFLIEKNGTLIKNPELRIKKFRDLRHFLSRSSALYNLISHIKGSTETIKEEEFNEFIEILKPEQDRRLDFNYNLTYLTLKRFKDVLGERGIKFVIVVLPMKEQVDENKLEELLKEYNAVGTKLDLEWSIRELENIGEAYDIPVINLLPEMRSYNKDNDFYFGTDIHFTKEGCRIVGELIFEHLVEQRLVENSSIE